MFSLNGELMVDSLGLEIAFRNVTAEDHNGVYCLYLQITVIFSLIENLLFLIILVLKVEHGRQNRMQGIDNRC